MRSFISFIFCVVLGWLGLDQTTSELGIAQNKPVPTGTSVTFTVSLPEGGEVPYIAWDFGDGSGLGRYKKSLTASYTFNEPGVYQVYARIQGEEIPLSVTQTVHKPLSKPAPTHTSTIVADTAHHVLWVVNPDNNSVSCIDMLSNTLLKEIPVGKHPRTLALDSLGNAWVSNEDDATISIVTAQGLKLHTLALPYGSRPFGICLEPLKRNAYVTLQGTGQLLRINVKTKEITSVLEVGRMPRAMAINSDGSKVFVSQFISPQEKGLVREINTASMTVSKEIELAYDQSIDFEDNGRGVPNFLAGLTITPDGEELWVPSKKDNTARGLFRDSLTLTFDNTVRTIVSKINLATSTEISESRTDINDADQACAVEFSPYGNIAFVALQGNGRVTMLNVATNSRLGILETNGIAPQGLVFNADGTRLYVHNFLSRNVTVFDTKDIILSNNFSPVVLLSIHTVLTEILSPEVLKGKQIFYNAQDERMTFAGYISCASCHVDGGSDERVWDFTERGEGLRNTHSLNGKGGLAMGRVHWTSNFDEIQDFENDMRNGFKGKGFLTDEQFNTGTIKDPLGDKKAGLSEELDALAAYVTSLNKVHDSPYRKQNGDLTDEALAGKEIFTNLECGSCHSGHDFTDRSLGLMHDVGTIQTSSGKRRGGMLTGFGTPTLKGIWETAPYLHDGSAATLKEVLTTRNLDQKHGDVSSLTSAELDQLLAYLNQIDENETNPSTGIRNQNVESISALSISPNPTTEVLHVQLNKNVSKNGTINIYSATNARLVKTLKTSGTSEIDINVSDLSAGMYTIVYASGIHQSSLKFVMK